MERDIQKIIDSAIEGRTRIAFNVWHTATFKAVEAATTKTFRLFGISYFLFGENLYSVEEGSLFRHTGWEEDVRALLEKLGA